MIFRILASPAFAEITNPFGTGQSTTKKSVTKTAKTNQAKKTESCANLPARCADIADCADAQRALRCGWIGITMVWPVIKTASKLN